MAESELERTGPDLGAAPDADGARDQPSWHALDLAEVERRLGTGSPGLTSDDARARLLEFGPNEIDQGESASDFAILLSQFRSPLVAVLVVAMAITLALGEYLDATVIAIVVVVNAAIGFVQERQADRSVRALQNMLSPRARVVRDGRDREIERRELVPGDVVLLESGSSVPADIRLAAATALQVDESALTGESMPVKKRADVVSTETLLSDRANIAFAGTTVLSGRGRGYVVATGSRTELGVIAHETQTIKRLATPFQKRLDRFVAAIGVGVLICAIVAFGIGVAAGEPPAEMFLVAVALAVSAIPEGLPIAFTITLALGVRRMAHRQAIVRHLTAVEALGGATLIGSDKTGTLTENRMTVRGIWTADRSLLLNDGWDEAGPDRASSMQDALHLTLLAGVMTNEASVERTADGIEVSGDPTESALLVAAMRFGLEPRALQEDHQVVAEEPFESERQYSISVRERAPGKALTFAKGAPERILAMCSTMLTDHGPVPLDREAVVSAANEFARRGWRVLAMAYRADGLLERDRHGGWIGASEDLVFLGLQGLADPPRAGAREAIAACQRAGVRVIMITGDHAETARAIAIELGISAAGARVITGVELATLTSAELDRDVAAVDVYARVTPEQKLSIVQALQRRGEVVVVTGDGVNDAPALRAADVGFAMGNRGTDVAKAAADVVLADDNFVSIAAAVEEGRITLANMRKVVAYLFSSNVAEVLIVLGALALGWPLPLIAAQILWLNLVTDSFQVAALAFEPAETDVMAVPTRGEQTSIVPRELWERIGLSGVVMTVGTLLLFRWELDHGQSDRYAQSVALTAIVAFQMAQALNMRSERRSILRMPLWSNPYLVVAIAGSIILHLASLSLPVTQSLLRVEPIDGASWARALLVALAVVIAVELHKVGRSLRPRSAPTT